MLYSGALRLGHPASVRTCQTPLLSWTVPNMTAMDPMPQTGRCFCGAAVWYVRPHEVGERGHFHCRRCGRRYGSNEEEWTPGAPPRYLT